VWTYCTIPTVREILVLHIAEPAAELLRRTADGGWPERFSRAGSTVDLASIAGTFSLASIYRHVAFDEA
jgi:hypothetical protein